MQRLIVILCVCFFSSSVTAEPDEEMQKSLKVLAERLAAESEQSSVAATSQDLIITFNVEQLFSLLRGAGYETVELVDSDIVRFKSEGDFIYLVVRKELIQAVFKFETKKIPIEVMNAWNSQHILSKAYLNDDRYPVLELSFSTYGGFTEDQISYFLSQCVSLIVEFKAIVTSYL